MARPMALAAAFVAGIAVGIVATRMSADDPSGQTQAGIATAPTLPSPLATPPSLAPPPPLPTPPPPDGSGTPAPPVPAAGRHAADPSPEKPAATSASPVGTPMADSGPIDAGDVFNKMIAQTSQPGFENSIGEAHRALERETRDDSWAYPMEGELQNSMVTETSTGAFRAEHVECRATMCELRLSGKGDQMAAIKRWSDELGSQPFSQRLLLNYSSSISDHDRVDTLMIFRRPPRN
jgi:hypothetical protein